MRRAALLAPYASSGRGHACVAETGGWWGWRWVGGWVAGGSFSACGSLTKLLESTSHACKKLATVGGVVGLAPCDDTPSNQVRRRALIPIDKPLCVHWAASESRCLPACLLACPIACSSVEVTACCLRAPVQATCCPPGGSSAWVTSSPAPPAPGPSPRHSGWISR